MVVLSNGVYYFYSSEAASVNEFGQAFKTLLQKNMLPSQTAVFLCIGTDRATGDCLGPLLGHKLSQLAPRDCHVFGTLEAPVHAKNLSSTVAHIRQYISNPFIIAVDASLGKPSHVGCFTLGVGPLKPGAGVNKNLPEVGDLFVTGIVNFSGIFDQMLLQTTRLSIVMTLAENIYSGIMLSFR